MRLCGGAPMRAPLDGREEVGTYVRSLIGRLSAAHALRRIPFAWKRPGEDCAEAA